MLDAGVGVGVAGVGVGVGVGVGGGGGMLATLVEPSPPHADSIRHSGSAIVPLKRVSNLPDIADPFRK